MFFCCQTPEKGDYAIEMFETPRELSTISHDKSVVLKGFVPKPRTQVVGLMSKNDKQAPIRLDQILNYIKTLHGDN